MEVLVPSQESGWSCIYVLGVIDFASFYDFCNYILELNSDSVHNVFLNKVFICFQ